MSKLNHLEGRIEDLEDEVKIHSCFIIWIIIIGIITIVFSLSVSIDFITVEDYCDEIYGVGFHYNIQWNEPPKVRSCDFMNSDGIMQTNFFSIDNYRDWKEQEKLK